MTGSNLQGQPFSILPHELLVDILPLAQPRALVPASSTVTASVVRDHAHIARSWTHHRIFHASTLATAEAELRKEEAWFFDSDPASRQLQSRLSTFLKSRLPELSASLAPIQPTQPEDILTAPYVDWLFSAHGPIRRDLQRSLASSDQSWKRQLDTLCGPLDDSMNGDLGPFEHPDRMRLLTHRHWQLVPDAFQLAIYFARAGHTGLFHRTLVHLLNTLPDLTSSPLPMSQWCQLTLDNRGQVRSALNLVIVSNGDPDMTFAAFLCFVGALDWSLPVIQAVLAVFHEHSVAREFTTWVNNQRGALNAMFDTIGACEEPDRVLNLLGWVYEHGLSKDQLEINDPSMDMPFMAPCAGTFQVFSALFTRYDLPKVLPLFEGKDGDSELELERKRQFRQRLGDSICWWVLEKGQRDKVLELGLKFKLFSKRTLAKLLLRAAEDGNVERQDRIVAHVKESTTERIREVVYTALAFDLDQPSPPSVRAALRSHLYDPVDTRTQYLLDNLALWNDAQLSTVVFEGEPPFSPSDYACFAHAWLRKIMDKELAVSVLLRQLRVLARVLTLALTEIDLTTLPVEALALAASLCVVMSGEDAARGGFSAAQQSVLDQIASRCQQGAESGRVACQVSDSGFRQVRPPAIKFLKDTVTSLAQRKRGKSGPWLSLNLLVFDFGVVLDILGEDDLIGT